MKKTVYESSDLRRISLQKTVVWEEGWKQIQEATQQDNIFEFFAKIEIKISQADNREKVLDLIDFYKRILKTDPLNYKALFNLARYYYLLAYGYTDGHKHMVENRKEKQRLYLKQIQCCEQALYSNEER